MRYRIKYLHGPKNGELEEVTRLENEIRAVCPQDLGDIAWDRAKDDISHTVSIKIVTYKHAYYSGKHNLHYYIMEENLEEEDD